MRLLVPRGVLLLVLSVATVLGTMTQARELDFEIFRILSVGMHAGEVLARAGEPDQRMDQFQPTIAGQALASYQFLYIGDPTLNEWTTIITFSAVTNKAIKIERHRFK